MKIKFYCALEKLRNTKICQKGTRVLALGLIPLLLTTGCVNKKNSKQYHQNPTTSQSYSINDNSSEDNLNNLLKKEIPEFNYDFQEQIIHLNKNDINLFKQEIDNIKTNYLYSELYDIDHSLSVLNANTCVKEINHHVEVLDSNGKVDSNKLYAIVKTNNQNYFNNNDKNYYDRELFLNKMSDSEIQEACFIVSNAINEQVTNVAGIDLHKVACVLSDLKMFNTPSSMNAYVSDDNCLVISPQMIRVVQISNKDKNVRKDVITHEAQHLIQKACNCEIDWKNESKIGFCKQNSKLDMNPLYWKWYFEACAEQNMCNLTQEEPTVYQYMIGYLNSLKLATLLNENATTTKLEELSLKDDIDSFYQLFDAKTESDQKEIIEMMIAIDIIQTEREDFLDKYQKTYGKAMSDDELVLLKRSLKGSICTTLSKCFYKNLADNISKTGKVSLQDTYYMIRTFEDQLNIHLEYDQKEKRECYPEFMESYVQIQNSFFQYLASSNQYSQEELIDEMNNFSYQAKYNGKLKSPNCNLNFLDDSKKNFIIDKQEKRTTTTQNSIQEIYQKDNEKILKK